MEGLQGREGNSEEESEKQGFTHQTQRKWDVKYREEVTRHVAEHRLI